MREDFLFPDEIMDVLARSGPDSIVRATHDGATVLEIKKRHWTSFDDGMLSSGDRYEIRPPRRVWSLHDVAMIIYDHIEAGHTVTINGIRIQEA